jgi:hypothetical protein
LDQGFLFRGDLSLSLFFTRIKNFMKNNGVINGLRRGESTTPIESELRNKAIDNIFELNLAVAKNERILVFADDYKPEIFAEAKYVAERGTHYGRVDFFKYPNTGMNGTEPPIIL